jgi:N-acetylmuramoyl-L-alanine amidase
MSKKSVIIDGGHGGTDPGAVGFGVREKDWTLRISLYQYNRLKELGANVGITRTTDTTLSSGPRTNKIKNKYDIAVSNHWNAFNGSARGIETIHSIFGGKAFATAIANALVKATGLPLRRVFSRKNSRGTDYYYMHRLTGNTRTIIVEYGFLDNRTDHNWYKNENNFIKAAEAVIEAICDEIGITYKAPGGSVSKPAPAPKPISGTLYKVQAGAFSVYKNAAVLHEKLEDKGIDAFVIQEGSFFKVQAGAYSKKANADAQLKKVKNIVNDAWVVATGETKPTTAPKPSKPGYIGKRVESKHNGTLRFYNKPSWQDKDVAGTIKKGYGFPTIVDKVKVGGAEQYKVKNSKGATYYITASSKYVRVV